MRFDGGYALSRSAVRGVCRFLRSDFTERTPDKPGTGMCPVAVCGEEDWILARPRRGRARNPHWGHNVPSRMWRTSLFLALVPALAQPPGFSDLVEANAKRSGLWEAPVDLDLGKPFGKITGLIINIEIDVEERSGVSTASYARPLLAVDWEKGGISRCYGGLRLTETHPAILISGDSCSPQVHLATQVGLDGSTVDGTIGVSGKSVPVKFARLRFDRDADREFQGIWMASVRDRLAAFHVSYSLTGSVLVTQDFTFRASSDLRYARLGEFWLGDERDHHLSANADRAAFNDTGFLASLAEGGDALLADRCGARMGLPCPVALRRARYADAFSVALRQIP